MTDHRLTAAFARLDFPAEPDPRFADRLFEVLAADLGFRPKRAPRGLGRRALRVSRLDPLPVGRSALRLAYLAAAVGLVLALAFAALIVGSLLRDRTAPVKALTLAEIVSASQAAYDAPPAFVEDFTDAFGEGHRLSSDGTGTWRVDALDASGAPAGDYELFDGTRSSRFDATTRLWSTTDLTTEAQGVRSLPFNGEFTWVDSAQAKIDPESGLVAYVLVACREPERLADESVAGLPSDHLRCPDDDMEFWLDRASHLILKIRAGASTPNWTPGAGMIATSLRLDAAPDSGAFSWAGPAGAFDASNPPPSTVLTAGEPVPSWTGRFADGKLFDAGTMPLPAALYFWAPWCPVCTVPMYDDVAAVAATHPGVHTIFVAVDSLGNSVGYAAEHPPGAPILDGGSVPPGGADHTLSTAWGLLGIPTLVLVSPFGDVAGVLVGPRPRAELDPLFAALAAGEALPPFDPMPQPGSDEVSTPARAWVAGDLVPTWRGPSLGGGHSGSADLLGKPTIIWSWTGGNCYGCGTAEIEAFDALAKEVGDRANLVVLSSGELTPGLTEDLVTRLGLSVPIVFDWDGSISASLWPEGVLGGYLAVDPGGRLVKAGMIQGGQAGPSLADIQGVLDQYTPR